MRRTVEDFYPFSWHSETQQLVGTAKQSKPKRLRSKTFLGSIVKTRHQGLTSLAFMRLVSGDDRAVRHICIQCMFAWISFLSPTYMILALCTAVTVCLLFALAYWNAKSATLWEASLVISLMLCTTPSTTCDNKQLIKAWKISGSLKADTFCFLLTGASEILQILFRSKDRQNLQILRSQLIFTLG